MLNINREYFALEKDRFLYQTKFRDKSKCNVYGRKKFVTDAGKEEFSAHVFLISKDFWTINAGQLDFTNYQNGIWNDYISVDIVELEEYTAPNINFGSMGDITPENLQNLSNYISKHLSDLERRIVEDYLYIDEGTAENIGLPNLPENHFWVRKNNVIVGVNLDYLKDDYNFLKEELKKDFKEFYQSTFEALKKALREYYFKIYTQATEELTKLKEKLLAELNDKVEQMIANIGDQQHRTVLPAGATTLKLPDTWVLSARFKIFADGVLLSPENNYTISNRTISFKKAWNYPVDIFLNDVIPPENVGAEFDRFLEMVKSETEKFNKNSEEKTKIFNNNFEIKKQEIDDIKTKAIKDIVIQEKSTLQNILNAESKAVTAVENKGTEEKKELEDMAVDIKTQLELLLQNADIANLQTLIGNCYKGVYSAFNKYYSGDIYYKKDTSLVAFAIPDRVSNTVAMLIPAEASSVISKEMTSEDTGTMSSPELTKTSSTQDIKKFFRLYGDVEKEYNFTDNGDNKITGFALGEDNRFIRTNSTIEFEINTINYTIAVALPDSEVTDLIKSYTTEQDNSATTLIKKQTDLPLYTLDTQRDPVLRKIHY